MKKGLLMQFLKFVQVLLLCFTQVTFCSQDQQYTVMVGSQHKNDRVVVDHQERVSYLNACCFRLQVQGNNARYNGIENDASQRSNYCPSVRSRPVFIGCCCCDTPICCFVCCCCVDNKLCCKPKDCKLYCCHVYQC